MAIRERLAEQPASKKRIFSTRIAALAILAALTATLPGATDLQRHTTDKKPQNNTSILATPPSIAATRYNSHSFKAGFTIEGNLNSPNFPAIVEPLLTRAVDDEADYISLNVPIFQDNYRSVRIYTDPRYTLSDDLVKQVVDLAHSKGLAVYLKYYLEDHNITQKNPGMWKGLLEPTDGTREKGVKEWFKSYRALIVPKAALAQSLKVEGFSSGNEFNSLEKYNSEWSTTDNQIRSVYTGKLFYAVDHDSDAIMKTYIPLPGFLSQLDFIGIDSYFPTDGTGKKLQDHAPVSDIMESLRPYATAIQGLKNRSKKRLEFSEWGTTSVAGSYNNPWSGETKGAPDQKAQSRYFQAVCNLVFKPGLVNGSDLFMLSPIDQTYNPATDKSFNIIDKLGEKTITDCYKSLHTT